MNPRIFQFTLLGSLLLAFVLLVLASLSVPIIKSISFLDASSDKATFTIGLYGACLEDSDGIDCTSSGIGFSLDSLSSVPGGKNTKSILSGSLPYGLVFHPIAAILVLASALMTFGTKPVLQTSAYFTSLLATFLALIGFIIDLWLFVQVRAVIEATTSMDAKLGAGLWLVVGSLLLLAASGVLGLKVRKLGKGM